MKKITVFLLFIRFHYRDTGSSLQVALVGLFSEILCRYVFKILTVLSGNSVHVVEVDFFKCLHFVSGDACYRASMTAC